MRTTTTVLDVDEVHRAQKIRDRLRYLNLRHPDTKGRMRKATTSFVLREAIAAGLSCQEWGGPEAVPAKPCLYPITTSHQISEEADAVIVRLEQQGWVRAQVIRDALSLGLTKLEDLLGLLRESDRRLRTPAPIG